MDLKENRQAANLLSMDRHSVSSMCRISWNRVLAQALPTPSLPTQLSGNAPTIPLLYYCTIALLHRPPVPSEPGRVQGDSGTVTRWHSSHVQRTSEGALDVPAASTLTLILSIGEGSTFPNTP